MSDHRRLECVNEMDLPLADVTSPSKVNSGRALCNTERLLGFNTHSGYMSARALRHIELREDVSRMPRATGRQIVKYRPDSRAIA